MLNLGLSKAGAKLRVKKTKIYPLTSWELRPRILEEMVLEIDETCRQVFYDLQSFSVVVVWHKKNMTNHRLYQ